MDVITPNGVMYIEWKALCVKLGVTKAKALLRNWETARDGRYAKTPHKTEQGVFIHSPRVVAYGTLVPMGVWTTGASPRSTTEAPYQAPVRASLWRLRGP